MSPCRLYPRLTVVERVEIYLRGLIRTYRNPHSLRGVYQFGGAR